MIRFAAITILVLSGVGGERSSSCAGPGSLAEAPAALTPHALLARADCKSSPPIWVAEDEDSQVWIVMVPPGARADMAWNETCVTEALTGSRKISPTPQTRMEPDELDGKTVIKGDKPSPTKLEDRLPAPLRAQVAEAAKTFRGPPVLDNASTGVAAELLYRSLMIGHGFGGNAPQARILELANGQGIYVASPLMVDATPMIAELAKKPEALAQACMTKILEPGWLPTYIEELAGLWASGDVASLQARVEATSLYKHNRCMATGAQDENVRARARGLLTEVRRDLRTPGKVMFLGTRDVLLDEGALLDQLEDAGVTVYGWGRTSPAG